MKVDERTGWLGALWNYVGWFVEVYLFSILSPPTFRVCVCEKFILYLFLFLYLKHSRQSCTYSNCEVRQGIVKIFVFNIFWRPLVSSLFLELQHQKKPPKSPAAKVLVHCASGISRSSTLCMAHLMLSEAHLFYEGKITWCPDSFGLFLDLRWYKLFRKEWFETF